MQQANVYAISINKIHRAQSIEMHQFHLILKIVCVKNN